MENKVGYYHKRLDTNEIFYVGIGEPSRPYESGSRNPHWYHVVDKVGYEVILIKENISWKEACDWEISEIKRIGRRDLGLGSLVNMTDGGEGIENLNPETRKLLSEQKVGENNHRFGKFGKDNYNAKLSDVDVCFIRENFVPFNKEFGIRALAKKFNVDRGTIKKIVVGESYRNDGDNLIQPKKLVGTTTNNKFSPEDIKYIRDNHISHHPEFGTKPMAIKFNTNETSIWKIVTKRVWKNI
jgi:hypothetical protein